MEGSFKDDRNSNETINCTECFGIGFICIAQNTHGKIILEKLDPSLYSNIKVIKTAIYWDFEKTARLADKSLLNEPDALNTVQKRLSNDKFGKYKSSIKNASLRLKLENR